MAKIKFRNIRMNKANKERLNVINLIIEEYQAQGYTLTLRQLYYQLVSRDIIPNKTSEYAKLSTLLKEGRMSGFVDWDAIEDRLRKPSKPSSWENPAEIINSCILQYQLPRQDGQSNYLEVWVEKDALSGVLSRVTNKYHVPILVNRGYSSASAMFDSFQRFKTAFSDSKEITILYLGDYDPSGLDMIRDIRERITEFIEGYYDDDADIMSKIQFNVVPIALTIEQIRQYNPPHNPAKISDPRAKEFIKNFGHSSWEVDALRPEVLNSLLTNAIETRLDLELYNSIVEREANDKKKLKTLTKYL